MGDFHKSRPRTGVIILFAGLLLSSDAVYAAVEISAQSTTNMSCSGGVCTPTAKKAVLNVNDLTGMLASGDTTIKSTSENSDIEIDASLRWASTSRLTLDSYRAIAFNKPVEITGTGALTIMSNDGGSGGDFFFFGKAHVKFWDTSSSLIINGNSYTLIRSVHDIKAQRTFYTALAHDYDASKRVYYKPPIKEFDSVFEGLGNAISHLTIQDRVDGDEVALFGQLHNYGANPAVIRDLRLTSVNIVGTGNQQDVAGLVGTNAGGTIINDYVDGEVTASGTGSFAAGVVAYNLDVTVTRLSANVAVSANGDKSIAGGLIGYAEAYCIPFGQCGGEVHESFTTGSVSVGTNGTAGGLIGQSYGTPISDSYATGPVNGGNSASVGGLVGAAFDNPSSNTKPIMNRSYSTAAVSGGSSAFVGGVIGVDAADATNTAIYWNVDTSGINNPAQGAGNIPNDPGITGLSDAQLKSGLPAGFDPSTWGEKAKLNSGYPYLIDNPPPK